MTKENAQINQIKEYLTSAVRAIGEDELIQIEFNLVQENNFFAWNQSLVDGKLLVLPQISQEILKQVQRVTHLHPERSERSSLVKKFRAASDLAACYFLFHDKEISAQNQCNLEEQKFFDDFEKIRVLANIKDSYLGIAKNILAKIEEDIYSDSNNFSLVLLNEIFADKILPRTGIAVEELRSSLSKRILGQIKNLTKKITNQSEFEKAVKQLLEMLREEDETNKKDQEQDGENKLPPQKNSDDVLDLNEENIEMENQLEDLSESKEVGEADASEQEKEITDFKEDEKGGSVKVKSEKTTFTEEKIEFKNAYKIFTSKFDEVVFPQKLVSKNELELLRDQLDLKMMKLDEISRRMTLKLKRKLMAKKNSYVEKDNNSGVLDRKKLTQFVLDPFMEDIWINNKEREYQDTALTILLDNSGSMRGQPIVMSALACEIIARILEKFLIKTEIIGFTTADWKGGRARKMWESSGRQKNPGRLNELRHIIYKSANQSFKKSKVNLGLMLKEGILKENIDGEALLFAKSRLMQRDEKRKILMVISDGTPIDDSTNSTNDEDILSDHLRHAINKIEKQSKIEVVGIGIGHSADEFYHNSITIKGLEELGDVMIEKLTTLL